MGVPNAARGGHGALGAPAHEPAGARGARPVVANATDWGLASSSSRALVDILTELELARRCEAFVGNCASLFSHAVLRSMCAAGDEPCDAPAERLRIRGRAIRATVSRAAPRARRAPAS